MAEAESLGDVLQRTTCDGITQVRHTFCSCISCSTLKLQSQFTFLSKQTSCHGRCCPPVLEDEYLWGHFSRDLVSCPLQQVQKGGCAMGTGSEELLQRLQDMCWLRNMVPCCRCKQSQCHALLLTMRMRCRQAQHRPGNPTIYPAQIPQWRVEHLRNDYMLSMFTMTSKTCSSFCRRSQQVVVACTNSCELCSSLLIREGSYMPSVMDYCRKCEIHVCLRDRCGRQRRTAGGPARKLPDQRGPSAGAQLPSRRKLLPGRRPPRCVWT